MYCKDFGLSQGAKMPKGRLLEDTKQALRASDIKGLKFHQINWESHRIDIIQRKTQKPLSLPLPNDVGWAIIDYVRNGRPRGNKIRQVPIMKKTALLIGKYLFEQKLETPDHLDDPLFTNRQKQKLTRAGITYILRKYSNDKSISPHTLRHTKAMHLLQAGVSSIYIRDILGHTSVDTTSIYARADAEMKRKAIEKISNETTPDVPDWTSDTALMDWLKSKT